MLAIRLKFVFVKYFVSYYNFINYQSITIQDQPCCVSFNKRVLVDTIFWFVTSLEIQTHLRREYCESYIGLEEIYWKSLLIKLSDSGWAFPH